LHLSKSYNKPQTANPNFPGYPDSGEYDIDFSVDLNGNKFEAFGFGRFSNNEKSGAEILRRTKLTYWDNCTAYLGGDYYNPNYHVCAYAKDDQGICKGDSGGPLVRTFLHLLGIATCPITFFFNKMFLLFL
jgi:Trypsin